eukprot:CAMPEP_0114564056 /NCGR_PEP_ID=MMETSP0114-20121206/13480_1 /TAXON_ID=31324 /ORGANISM="Goniomonas sp, Strain m" /LENGTH=292 /DNA_ID=CAMNT_0001750025 /DNA_START=35 /DNA_END=909 /DNA_ORIENTATION=-
MIGDEAMSGDQLMFWCLSAIPRFLYIPIKLLIYHGRFGAFGASSTSACVPDDISAGWLSASGRHILFTEYPGLQPYEKFSHIPDCGVDPFLFILFCYCSVWIAGVTFLLRKAKGPLHDNPRAWYITKSVGELLFFPQIFLFDSILSIPEGCYWITMHRGRPFTLELDSLSIASCGDLQHLQFVNFQGTMVNWVATASLILLPLGCCSFGCIYAITPTDRDLENPLVDSDNNEKLGVRGVVYLMFIIILCIYPLSCLGLKLFSLFVMFGDTARGVAGWSALVVWLVTLLFEIG